MSEEITETEKVIEYTIENINVVDLYKLLYIYPQTIYNYFIYEIKFYSILNREDIETINERINLNAHLLSNHKENKFCKEIKIGFILKSIVEDEFLITIRNLNSGNYVGILTCKDLYPNNSFVISLLCSVSVDPYTKLTMSFGLLLQHILLNYIYDEYENENENEDIFSIYLNALEDVHEYYLKLGYTYGNNCNNKNEYKFKNDENLYSMKLCNINKTRTIIYDKILSKLNTTWLKLSSIPH